jgi:hypothetical protein
MSDHIPNDLSHLSDAEFHSLCPQGEHAPGPEPLSPAAQAVLDAFSERYELCGPFDDNWQELCLAAAFRAVADQVVPYESHPVESQFWDYESEREWQNNHHVRLQLLAIADELDGQP